MIVTNAQDIELKVEDWQGDAGLSTRRLLLDVDVGCLYSSAHWTFNGQQICMKIELKYLPCGCEIDYH